MSRNKQSGRRAIAAMLFTALGLTLFVGASPGTRRADAAQTQPTPTSVGAQRQEVFVVRVYFRDVTERDRLAVELGAEEVSTLGGYLTVFADRQMYNNILARGLRVQIDQDATREANAPAPFTSNSPHTFYGGYKTVEEMQAYLDQMAASYPTLAEKVDIGDSWCKTHPGSCTQPSLYNGYDLMVLHITNRNITGPKPVFWLDTGIHSREIATPEMASRFISLLLDNYNTNADSRWLVDYHDIWVMPMLNPDGHHIVEAGGGGNSPYYQRKNADNSNGCSTWPPTVSSQFGIDLNRNFPFKWACCGGSNGAVCDQQYHGPSAASEDETQQVMAKVRTLIPDQRGTSNSAAAPITATGVVQSMHSYAALNLYPWGWTTTSTANGVDLANIANHMTATNAGGNGYEACQPGNCLYAVDGDSFDWSYGELGAASFTTELSGGTFLPAYSTIESTWNMNKGMLTYLAKIARTPYLTTRGPDANNVTISPASVAVGQQSILTASINYAWSGNSYSQNVAAAEYYVDAPPWAGGTGVPMQPDNGSYNSPTEGVSAHLDTTNLLPGRHIVFVRGRGVNNYQGFQSWGPVSAAFLDVTGTPQTTPTVPVTSATPTQTQVPPTATGTANRTATASSTSTVIPSSTTTVTAISSSTATATICPLQFEDVLPTGPSSTFYPYVRCLACKGIISGYQCGGVGEPCNSNHDPYFRPNNPVSRGQIAKIVAQSAGFTDPVPATQQTFEDVVPGTPFHPYVERLASRGIVGGYQCGLVANEPCIPPLNRKYYRPDGQASRGQLAKIVSEAAGFHNNIPADQYTFTDVPPGSTFWVYIERLLSNRPNVMSGYQCGGPGEACDAQNRHYFRWGNPVTRGQASKIDVGAFFPGCAP